MLFTILGSGGFIGTRLERHFRENGHEVYAPGKGAAAIFDRDLGRVVYAVGLTADFRHRPYDTVEAHVCLLSRILREAHFSTITYLSSTRVYQGAKTGNENCALRVFPDADGLYNLTKLTGEALCLQTGRAQVARLSNIVGEGASESFVSQLMAAAVTGRVQLRSALSSAKDYLLIDDAINALAALATHGETGIYNIASGQNISTAEILEALSTRLKFEASVAESGTEFSFPLIDVARISKLLGWQPQCVTTWIKETMLLKQQ
ncbi:MAG: NAD(P)-dependent oxidoreductase [Nitrosomonas sp.]|nr:NAD(P)-dependent oxidoreductase [Nitrosomonas sp.]MDP1951385.1 NAD(P)-dependent oxidoreductase [Nitrosomonas sp.]